MGNEINGVGLAVMLSVGFSMLVLALSAGIKIFKSFGKISNE